ncbi:MAG: TldD/PmbA family protein [Thermoproteota archaeon]|nr:TldD/PmbA family protein [Thermoproteota archaeon]
MSRLDLCKYAVDIAIKAGAKEAEALVAGGRTIGAKIERGEIKSSRDVMDVGIAVRSILDGKIGFAYTNVLDREEAEKTAIQAVKASKASKKDKNWKQLPKGERYPHVEKTYDKRILEFTSDEAVALCQRMMAAAVQVDKRVLPASGGAEVSIIETACVNSQGVEVEDKGTTIVCFLAAMARSATQVSPMCYEFKPSRTYEINPEWVGQEAAKLAAESLNVGKAQAGKFPILLDQIALQSVLTATFVQSVRGDIVSRGRSVFEGKVGENVAGENISIYDDGTLAGGLNSGKTDMEGVPKQKTALIEKGVLRGFLYDNYWAGVEGKKSTGNAGRGGGGLMLPRYGTTPVINPSNVKLQPGTASEDELVKEVGDGYYVRMVQGAHQSNPETGEFSVALAPAWRIENGEIKHAVKGVMIAGNAYQMLNKISVLGKEARQVGSLIAPKIIISELNVVT